jgi:acetyltransferase-like isoleucine patch superfamily enzyme
MRRIYRFNHIGRNVLFAPSCDVRLAAAPYIHIGNEVRIGKDVWLNIPYEVSNSSKIEPIIKLRDGVVLGRRCTISGINMIEIGEDCIFAPSVFITDHSHEFKDSGVPIKHQGVTEGCSIVIESGCWFGHNCAVVGHRGRDVRIGGNSIIGANALVTKSFPENSVLIGNPARNVGKISRGS